MSRKKKRSGSSRSSLFKIGSIRVNRSDVPELIGAAGAGLIGGLVSQVTSNKLTGNAAQAIGGLVLGFGGKTLGYVGKGALKATAADLIEENLIPQISSWFGGSGGGSGMSGSPAPTTTQGTKLPNGATF